MTRYVPITGPVQFSAGRGLFYTLRINRPVRWSCRWGRG